MRLIVVGYYPNVRGECVLRQGGRSLGPVPVEGHRVDLGSGGAGTRVEAIDAPGADTLFLILDRPGGRALDVDDDGGRRCAYCSRVESERRFDRGVLYAGNWRSSAPPAYVELAVSAPEEREGPLPLTGEARVFVDHVCGLTTWCSSVRPLPADHLVGAAALGADPAAQPGDLQSVVRAAVDDTRDRLSARAGHPVRRRVAREVLALDVAADLDPYVQAVQLVVGARCAKGGCASDADWEAARRVLGQSVLVAEAVGSAGSEAFEAWAWAGPGSAADRVELAAWTALMEQGYLDALGFVPGDEVDRRTLQASALALSSGAAQPMAKDHAAPCTREGRGSARAGPPFGECGVPGVAPVDPSPVSFGGPAPVVEAPAWMIPGPCFGLDPSHFFGAAQPPNAATGGLDDDPAPDPGGDSAEGAPLDTPARQLPKPGLRVLPESLSVIQDDDGVDVPTVQDRMNDGTLFNHDASVDQPQVTSTVRALKTIIGIVKRFSTDFSGLLKGEKFVLKYKGTYTPLPGDDSVDLCRQSAAAGLAGCMNAPAVVNGPNDEPPVNCGRAPGPRALPDPDAPAVTCECAGVPAESDPAESLDPPGPAGEPMPCCDAFCFAVEGACDGCSFAAECYDSSGVDNLVARCSLDNSGLGPHHVAACGAVDPAPTRLRLEAFFRTHGAIR